MSAVKDRLSIRAFKTLTQDQKERLLSQIEAALLSKARRGKRIEDLELEVGADLNISNPIVKEVSSSRKFKTKLQSRLM